MLSPNSEKQNLSETRLFKPKKLEKKLKPMSGISGLLERTKRNVKGVLLAAGISGTAAAGAGEYTQHKYREVFDYNPELIAQNESAPTKMPEKSWLEQSIKKAREITSQKFEEMSDIAELGRKYKDLKNIYDKFVSMKPKALETGDKLSYYTAFLLTFVALVKILSFINKLRKPTDPVVEDNLNLLNDRLLQIEAALEGGKSTYELDLEKLTREVATLRSNLEAVQRKTISK